MVNAASFGAKSQVCASKTGAANLWIYGHGGYPPPPRVEISARDTTCDLLPSACAPRGDLFALQSRTRPEV
jgi:hypothetical protein